MNKFEMGQFSNPKNYQINPFSALRAPKAFHLTGLKIWWVILHTLENISKLGWGGWRVKEGLGGKVVLHPLMNRVVITLN